MQLLRTQQMGTVAWCCLALGMLFYAIGRTIWTLADVDAVAPYPQGVPYPSLPDLFFILQYPCFFLALVFIPALTVGRLLSSVRILVDGVLWMSAITALTWYFVLLPIATRAGESSVAKQLSIGYLVGDLVLVYGVVVVLVRPHRRRAHSGSR